MGTPSALVLGTGLTRVPAVMVQVSQIVVNRLGKERTATDGPVGSVTIFVLFVSFVKDFSMGNIQLFNSCIVNIRDEGIEQKVVVFQALLTSIEIMQSIYTIEVTDSFLQALENFC